MPTQTHLKRAQRRLDDARVERDRVLIEAHANGVSYRVLAQLSGLGVETVRRIVLAKGTTS